VLLSPDRVRLLQITGQWHSAYYIAR
jgi:hypothetical protein